MTVKYSGEGIRDNTDETKIMNFDVSGVTTNTTRTLTMPDRNVTIGDAGDLTGNLPAIDGSNLQNLPGGGITDVSKWGTSPWSASGDTNPVTGWSEETKVIGSSMTHSNGVFSFPSTGIWEVTLVMTFYKSDGSGLNIENVTGSFYLSTDGGSSWGSDPVATGQTHFDSPGNDWWRSQVTTTAVLDITNTSTHKVKTRAYVYGGTALYINSNQDTGGIWFKRLGDT